MYYNWKTQAHGWEGTLAKLNKDRNDYRKPRHARKAADQAHSKILRNLQDKRLMSLRERLIRASLAGDEPEIRKITQVMRDYNSEDRESGLYGDE